jgi:hypothetical protein
MNHIHSLEAYLKYNKIFIRSTPKGGFREFPFDLPMLNHQEARPKHDPTENSPPLVGGVAGLY